MFISNIRSRKVYFCLLYLLFFVAGLARGQNDDINISSKLQKQQMQQFQQNKVNSINVNNKSTTSDKLELSTRSDSVVLSKKHSNLNSRYETQSPVTSSPLPPIGLFPGSKKSE
jgi:hypothetical protein